MTIMNDQEANVGDKIVEARNDAERDQLEAHERGDIGAELGAFVKEVAADTMKFPTDVVQDIKDPERRVDEEQGTAVQEGSEPTP